MSIESNKLTIVVLTYNRERLLRGCLQSLFDQDIPQEALEILVSDDGSRDSTRQLVSGLQAAHSNLRYVYREHRGIAAARNHGIASASGDIIAIVADDYILSPDYATTIVEFFASRPEAMVVRFKVVASRDDPGSRISHFYFDSSVRRRLAPAQTAPVNGFLDAFTRLWRVAPAPPEAITTSHNLEAAGAAAFRREVFARCGLFDEAFQRAEDTELTNRLRRLGIDVYYYPHHQIRHVYGWFLQDSIYKCFQTGRNRYKLYQKYQSTGDGRQWSARTAVLNKIGGAFDALARARQEGSMTAALFYLPFMFLFEATNKLGFLCSLLTAQVSVDRLKPRRGR
jgi:GT2 family glycosyltransferase